LALADSFAAGDRTMMAQVPVSGVRTLYSRTGDLFAWLCVAALAITLGAAALAPRWKSTPITERRVPRAGRSTAFRSLGPAGAIPGPGAGIVRRRAGAARERRHQRLLRTFKQSM
jgi:hypothetical protein